MLQVHQFPCLSDNYGFLLHDPDSGASLGDILGAALKEKQAATEKKPKK